MKSLLPMEKSIRMVIIIRATGLSEIEDTSNFVVLEVLELTENDIVVQVCHIRSGQNQQLLKERPSLRIKSIVAFFTYFLFTCYIRGLYLCAFEKL